MVANVASTIELVPHPQDYFEMEQIGPDLIGGLQIVGRRIEGTCLRIAFDWLGQIRIAIRRRKVAKESRD